ncbi:hypothetical protein ACDN41_26840 [Priestia aryabhattai]|uniref:hypothetical protein n=1 Tax=Priestia aryabhattai TaxID=412384 RepID=UPI003531A4D2
MVNSYLATFYDSIFNETPLTMGTITPNNVWSFLPFPSVTVPQFINFIWFFFRSVTFPTVAFCTHRNEL